jgi:oligopeptide transport system substrate-binding protein
MTHKFLPFFFVAVILASCGGGGKKEEGPDIREAKGGVFYGGIFKINEVEDFKNLFPLSINDAPSFRIAGQVYQGLLKLDQATLEVKPCLAESFTVSEDATKYTFKLHKGIKFQNDPCFKDGQGREMNAHDVKYCFDRICTASADNVVYVLFESKVKGAKEYYESTKNGKKGSKEGVSGIKVIDDYTIEVELNFPFSAFPKIIAHNGCWIFPKEAYEKYKDEMRVQMVGTGPFIRQTVKDEMVLLKRNPNYWEKDEHGNQLPYLDGIKFTFKDQKKIEFLEFNKKHLDMVWKLPVEEIQFILANRDNASSGNAARILQETQALAIQFYGFQTQGEIFNNKKVRQAFNFAIDREKLCTFTLQGEGRPAAYGFVPPYTGYPYQNVVGYTFDPGKAKSLLAEGGYPGGRGFPACTLYFNSGGTTNELLAVAIQNELKENLNIDVTIQMMKQKQLIDYFVSGKADFWRSAWVADYPDPENFLNMFYGKYVPENPDDMSNINFSRYKNEEYDKLFELALRETDEAKRMELFAKCDQMIIDDAVVMPIYYDSYQRLLQTNIANFPINAMEYRDFSRVYFVKEKKKKKKSK